MNISEKINSRISIVFFLTIFMLSSCTDSWLEPKPLSFLSPENTFINQEGMESALVVCRKHLQYEYNTNNDLTWIAEYSLSDLAVAGMAGGMIDLTLEMLPSGTGDTEENWERAFDGINSANIVISRTPDMEEAEEVKNMLLAEGYFHRAYWYYKLVNQYGDVPLILEETTFPKLDFYSSTRERIIIQMIEDMEFAVQWLPESVVFGKVSSAAARHLLAKLYLTNGDFDKAIDITTEVIDGSQHHLMTSRFGVHADDPEKNVFWDLFQKENISSPENAEAILVLQDRYLMDGGTNRGSRRGRYLVPAWYRAEMLDPSGSRGCTDGLEGEPLISITSRGIGKFKMTNYHSRQIWLDAGNDIRHLWPNWFPMDSIYYNNPSSDYFGQPVQQEYCIDTLKCWDPFMYCKAFVDDEDRPQGSGTNPYGGHSDWYIFRLAETYLLRAEAHVWKGENGPAADDVNTIRDRVNAPPLSAGDMSIETILDERARELFFEEGRKSELTRIAFLMAKLGRRGYSLENIHESNFYYDRVIEKNEYFGTNYVYGSFAFTMAPYHMLWPIDEDVIASNSQGRINQNYGYPGYEDNVEPIGVDGE
jgi:starch-binding outer membrane protein, SusD/RagB family